MQRKIRVVLDCDDVLFQSTDEAIRKLNLEAGTNYCLNDVSKWGEHGTQIDCRLEYFHDPDFVRSIPVYPGAKEFVRSLSEIAEIFIATSVHANCAGARVESVIREFPEIDPGNILIGKRKDLIQADFLLDDAEHNIAGSQIAYPVLYRQPWNYDITGCLTVGNYNEFLKLIDLVLHQPNKRLTHEIVALVGPSGSGKKELVDYLCEHESYKGIRTYTTNQLAQIGRYNIVTKNEFQILKKRGFFFETAIYIGHFYGTCKTDIDQVLDTHGRAVLCLDINGAVAMKLAYGNRCTTVFAKREKSSCIRSILESNLWMRERMLRTMTLTETVKRIASIEEEQKNAGICDRMIEYEAVNEGIEKMKGVLA